MRLSDWRAEAPARESLSPQVLEVVAPVMRALAGDADPDCWVVWGDEPTVRYTILAPTVAGLVTCFVRVAVPGEGPRASAKLVRWNRVQLGELAVETQGGHRMLSFQVESSVLRGADETADRIGVFAQELLAAVDGRPAPPPSRHSGRSDGVPELAPVEDRVSDPSAGAIMAVIFDLDGVIVDSEIWWDEVRQQFAAERDRPWGDEDRLAVMGANSRGWRRIMRERLGIDEPEEGIERAIVDGVVARFGAEGPPIIEGAADAVRRIAARWPVAIASSAHREVIDAALRSVGLTDHLPVIVSSDEVEHGKPEPDVYLEAARRLGVGPERCLVVEDSYNGVRAGRNAGMTVVLVPNRSIPPAEGTHELADLVLESLADLDPTSIPSAGRA